MAWLVKRVLNVVAAIAIAVSIAAGASVAAAVLSAAAAPAGSGELSDVGQDAIGDLRTCLDNPTVPDILNVYYLIDAERVFESGIMGEAKASDKDTLRAPILANSLEQLGGIDGGADVFWSAGFFNGGSSTRAKSTGRLIRATPGATSRRRSRPRCSRRHQLAGRARPCANSLSDQHAENGGCQLLIWLTDGQLDFREGSTMSKRSWTRSTRCVAAS